MQQGVQNKYDRALPSHAKTENLGLNQKKHLGALPEDLQTQEAAQQNPANIKRIGGERNLGSCFSQPSWDTYLNQLRDGCLRLLCIMNDIVTAEQPRHLGLQACPSCVTNASHSRNQSLQLTIFPAQVFMYMYCNSDQ